ncbi:MAG TPA: DUF3185 family protein [Planctomycetota bacterium]|nr:DUF3185 family protein [Planctomycetota bacterium]
MKMPIALALLVVGIALLLYGLAMNDSLPNVFSRMFTGHPTDRTMWFIIGGAVCAAVGAAGCFRARAP